MRGMRSTGWKRMRCRKAFALGEIGHKCFLGSSRTLTQPSPLAGESWVRVRRYRFAKATRSTTTASLRNETIMYRWPSWIIVCG